MKGEVWLTLKADDCDEVPLHLGADKKIFSFHPMYSDFNTSQENALF